MDLIELVYVSKAVERFKQSQLTELLTQARDFNQRSGVTGLLLYDGYGTFIQALEGEPEAVESLFYKIKGDPRHSHVTRIGLHQIHQRSFPDWQMGFETFSTRRIERLEGYSDCLTAKATELWPENVTSFALKMVRHFAINVSPEKSYAQ